jgi:pimeloyl-ACP methyl ester carboxylesterase
VAGQLHGFPDTARIWRSQIAALTAAGYRAIAPDLRGRGRSERPSRVSDYSLAALVGDVTGIMDALGVERAHVVGHEWGAGSGERGVMSVSRVLGTGCSLRRQNGSTRSSSSSSPSVPT